MAIRYDGGRAAITEYVLRDVFGPFAVVEAFPRSGRTHQIRVHLSFMGLPILCDQLYGREKLLFESSVYGRRRAPGETPVLARQALHARSISFAHPRTGRLMRIEAALPPDMLRVIGFLRRVESSRQKTAL
jgi:23S rRNA-/tRNA-specific pseudouridylate synthase